MDQMTGRASRAGSSRPPACRHRPPFLRASIFYVSAQSPLAPCCKPPRPVTPHSFPAETLKYLRRLFLDPLRPPCDHPRYRIAPFGTPIASGARNDRPRSVVLTAMLLPSALPCEAATTLKRPQRPLLPSFSAYQPQAQTPSTQSTILCSCRALQTLIGNALPSPRLLLRSPPQQLRNPFEAEYSKVVRAPKRCQPPRGANKRRRDAFEDTVDEEHNQYVQQGLELADAMDTHSTPKRQRRVPLCMPLGLSAADFRSLEMPAEDVDVSMPEANSPEPYSDDDSGYGPSPVSQDKGWTVDDDRVLVETVLEKLRLSKRDWNTCAKKLGKDRDSIGRRWNLLVGEGEVGLRRGGKVRRAELDIRSW